MTRTPETHQSSFAETLLTQDLALSGRDYAEYRGQLAAKLERAERRARTAYWICAVSGVMSFSLMFVGGSRFFGSFDPWDDRATPLSIALGGVFLVSSVLFWVLLASYYSRLSPETRKFADQLRDAKLDALEQRIIELQETLTAQRAERKPDAEG